MLIVERGRVELTPAALRQKDWAGMFEPIKLDNPTTPNHYQDAPKGGVMGVLYSLLTEEPQSLKDLWLKAGEINPEITRVQCAQGLSYLMTRWGVQRPKPEHYSL